MKTYTLRSRLRATAATALISSAMFAAPAFAQDAAEDEDVSVDTIIVTGTRINAPNLESANPITVITGEEIFKSGNSSVGDQLNDLPQLRNTFSQQNGTRFLGTRGLNLLDLRGLGSERTLVLVNGRRHVASDILSTGVSVDVNMIPSELIDRIDISTGGASATYGSDAIAGVVNFVLMNNFDGIKARAAVGTSQYGDLGEQLLSVTAGKNFAEDRGNIAINLEYSHSGLGYASGRPGLRRNQNFIVTDTDPAGSVNGSDGVFDRTFYNDLRSSTIAPGGMVAIRYPNLAGSPCGNDGIGNAFTCALQFQEGGSLIPQTGSRIGLGPNGNFLGGNGETGREGSLIVLAPDLKRYTANLLAHFEFSPALVPFIEAKYSRTDVFGSQSGPFFAQGQTLGDLYADPALNDRSYASATSAARGSINREGVRLDNPYLSAAARATISQQMISALSTGNGVNPNTGAAFNTTAQSLANKALMISQINAGTARFSLRRRWTDLGNRDEHIQRETYRLVGGLRGDFNDDWKYELSVNYGQHKERNVIDGNVNLQRFLLAIDSTRDASGNIVCRSKLDTAAGTSYVTGDTTSDARLAGDIASCVPLNPFGQGSVSKAARDYVLVDSLATGKITQLNVMGYVSGDTSGFFNLPGGPVAFSIGGEYRREKNYYDLDDLTQEGYAFYNAIPTFRARAFEVKEAFGELYVPLLKDTPFFHELSLKGNGRVADYKGATGTVYAYGGEAVWKPIEDITLRGTYSRSVRAPNLQELFSQQSVNFAPAPNDPCSERNLATGSSTRVANCAAAGRPAGYDFVYNQSLEIRSGGNPGLREETSDSYTLGVLLQPRFIPGLSLSADYYDITVNDVITTTGTPQTILNLCYDSATLNNPFCGLFARAGANGGPAGEIPFQVLESSLLQSTANFAKFKVRGLDVNLDYVHTFDFGKLKMNAIWTHVMQNDTFTDPTDPTFKDRILDELNDPTDQVNLRASFERGKVTFGYEMLWIDKMYLNTYEDYNGLNGGPPQNADYAPIEKYPAVFYHNIDLTVKVNDRFEWYAGVDNLFNKMPPFGLTGVGAGSGIYNNTGRYFYTGLEVKF